MFKSLSSKLINIILFSVAGGGATGATVWATKNSNGGGI